MFNLKKIGAAVAIAVLTSLGAVSANAAILTFLPGDSIPSPNFDDTLFFRNGTSDIIPGGSLAPSTGFDGTTNFFEFVVDASINPPGISLPVHYEFSVTTENGGTVGIANLTFNVFRNSNPVAVNTVVLTNGSGVLDASQATFDVSWGHGDTIRWEVSGTVLSAGGSYEVAVNAVPLPASVLMLVAALAGFGFVGRMKKTRFTAA